VQKRKQFFFEKKNQKTFDYMELGGASFLSFFNLDTASSSTSSRLQNANRIQCEGALPS